MRDYEVVTSDEALEDADQVYDYICNQLFAPMTAALYYQGLMDTMRKLGKMQIVVPLTCDCQRFTDALLAASTIRNTQLSIS